MSYRIEFDHRAIRELDGRSTRGERACCRIKKRLIDAVRARFGDAISLETREDRRVHFVCREDAESLRPVVDAMLEASRPWQSLGGGGRALYG